jgi:hypothetical protein
MSDENAVQEKTELSLGQRVAANKVIADDINKAGNGLSARVWTVAGKSQTGVNIYKESLQFATATVNGGGFIALRNYLVGTKQALLEELVPFGIEKNQWTVTVNEYKQYSGNKFDMSRITATAQA